MHLAVIIGPNNHCHIPLLRFFDLGTRLTISSVCHPPPGILPYTWHVHDHPLGASLALGLYPGLARPFPERPSGLRDLTWASCSPFSDSLLSVFLPPWAFCSLHCLCNSPISSRLPCRCQCAWPLSTHYIFSCPQSICWHAPLPPMIIPSQIMVMLFISTRPLAFIPACCPDRLHNPFWCDETLNTWRFT